MMFLGLQTGSLADWFSAIGSVGALFAVWWQIKEQRREYEEDRKAHLKIACWKRFKKSKVSDGEIVFSNEFEIAFWATNDGNTAGSFRFVGVCTLENYKKIMNANNVDKKNEYLNKIVNPYIAFWTDDDKNKFEKIEPKCVSATLTVSLKFLKMNFTGKRKLCLVYMDPIGKTYEKEIDMQ